MLFVRLVQILSDKSKFKRAFKKSLIIQIYQGQFPNKWGAYNCKIFQLNILWCWASGVLMSQFRQRKSNNRILVVVLVNFDELIWALTMGSGNQNNSCIGKFASHRIIQQITKFIGKFCMDQDKTSCALQLQTPEKLGLHEKITFYNNEKLSDESKGISANLYFHEFLREKFKADSNHPFSWTDLDHYTDQQNQFIYF